LAPRRHARPHHPRPAAPPLLFRGWLVVAGAFLVMMVGYGAAYSYAAFADALAKEFDATTTSLDLVYGLCGFIAFVTSAVSGPLADRVGPRPLAAAGMALVAIGLLTAATARTLTEIFLCYGLLIGLGIGFAYVPSIAAVQRWFVAWRGLASGLAAAGIGVGTALVPPAAGLLGALGDWRTGFAWAGALAAVIGIGGALLLAASPERYGLRCDGAVDPPAGPIAPPPEGARLAAVLRRRTFWRHYLGTLLVSVPVSLPFAHLARSAESTGVARADALYLLSLIGVGSIAGRFALGALADEIGRRTTFLSCCVAVVGLTGFWAFADSHVVFVVFAVGFGAAYGGFVALLPAVTTDRFGRCSAGGVIGVLYTGRGLALLLAAPLLAVLVAGSGGYGLPLGLMTLAGAAGVVLLAVRG
jgi:MFS family permease